MLINLERIPFYGASLTIIESAMIAIPFWFGWTVFGVGEEYFYFLPEVYHSVPFWKSVGLFTVAAAAKLIVFPRRYISNQISISGDSKEREKD